MSTKTGEDQASAGRRCTAASARVSLGNPRGRPRGSRARANALALAEAYRLITVREGDRTLRIPALQAVLRAQIALAAKGTRRAQRALLQLMRDIESTTLPAADVEVKPSVPAMSDLEAARRIAFVLTQADRHNRNGGTDAEEA